MTKLEEFKKDLNFLLVTARKPLVWLESFDYVYIVDTLKEVFNINKDVEEKDIAIWDVATHLVKDISGSKLSFADDTEMENPNMNDSGEQPIIKQTKNYAKLGKRIAMFKIIPNKSDNSQSSDKSSSENENGNPLIDKKLLVAKVSEELFEDKDDRLIARLQDFVESNNKKGHKEKKTILLISSYHFEVRGLEHICERLEMPRPDKEDIRHELCLDRINDANNEFRFSESFKLDVLRNSENLIDALHGMYLYDIKSLLKTIQSESYYGMIAPFDNNYGYLDERVKKGKRQIVKNSGLLEVIEVKDNYDKYIADIDNLRKHLEHEKKLLDNAQFLMSGLPKPRGILLVGAPGCGKSESAKAASSILKYPLYRLNIGDLLGHKYGQSENRFNEALRTADGSAPCVLWIDEIEKAFAGAGSGDDNNDVLTHIIGRFLTWMQEHETIVYLVATANDLSKMRPELLRKGRWDEIFYLSYPSPKGRLAIFRECLKRYSFTLVDCKNELVDFEEDSSIILNIIMEGTEGMSGAEISSLVIEASKESFLSSNESDTFETSNNYNTNEIRFENIIRRVHPNGKCKFMILIYFFQLHGITLIDGDKDLINFAFTEVSIEHIIGEGLIKNIIDQTHDISGDEFLKLLKGVTKEFIMNNIVRIPLSEFHNKVIDSNIKESSCSIKGKRKQDEINKRVEREIDELEIRRGGRIENREYIKGLITQKIISETIDAKQQFCSQKYELEGYKSAS